MHKRCSRIRDESLVERWSREIRLHSMIFHGENRRGRDSFSTGYLIPLPPSFFDIRRFIFFPDIIYVWIQDVKARRSCEKLLLFITSNYQKLMRSLGKTIAPRATSNARRSFNNNAHNARTIKASQNANRDKVETDRKPPIDRHHSSHGPDPGIDIIPQLSARLIPRVISS